jgi:hypothetical protein
MKNPKAFVCVVFLLAVLSANAEENVLPDKPLPEPLRLIAPIQFGEKLTLKLWGFGQVNFTDTVLADECQWTNLRLSANLDGKRLGVGTQINFSDLQDTTDGNWLRELYVQYMINEKWKLRAGRILLSCGRGIQIPGPFLLETIDYPISQPWASYAYGLQAWQTTKDWSLIFDITGRSGLPFDSELNFNRLESSARIRRNFEQGFVGVTAEISSDFLRLGIDGGWTPNKLVFLRGEFDYADNFDEQTSNRFGAYLLAGVRPVRWWEVSVQPEFNQDLPKYWTETVRTKGKDGKFTVSTVDKLSSDKVQSDLVFTTRFIGDHDLWSVKLDYVLPLENKKPGETDKGKFQAQCQFRF